MPEDTRLLARITSDVRPGGTFSDRMEAGQGSRGFDFAGHDREVLPPFTPEYPHLPGSNARAGR